VCTKDKLCVLVSLGGKKVVVEIPRSVRRHGKALDIRVVRNNARAYDDSVDKNDVVTC